MNLTTAGTGVKNDTTSTPAESGFRMPAEWAPHRGCWMAWPCCAETYPDLEPAREAFACVARAIARFEPLTMVADPEDAGVARRRCGEGVRVVAIPIDDSWMRDTGPTFLSDGRGNLAGVDWKFNCWGGLKDDYADDAMLARRVLELSGARRFESPIFLEGGAIHTDGVGTLLTTENVVLNANRNPGLSKADADEIFREFLGVERVIWLDKALEVDATDGHVDNLACFVRPGVVAALSEPDPADPHHAPLRENRRRLEQATDAQGRRLTILDVREPARREHDGERLAMSYINHYIANGGVVLPVFDDPADGPAKEVLARAFPDREVVTVPGLDIVKNGEGCVHCITQQEPAP
jgi:agmatine deiminase